jgi:hypothetical protein
MEYTSELDSTGNICTVHVTGKLYSPKDGDELKRAAVRIYSEHACSLFLFDMTHAEIVTGTMQAFDTGSPQGELAERLRRFKVAVLYSDLTEHEQFFENVAVNRGFRVHVFNEIDKAVEWLKQSG